MKPTSEWDEEKAEANLSKHHISFDEAETVFDDPLSITISDPDHSNAEQRFIDIGALKQSVRSDHQNMLTQNTAIPSQQDRHAANKFPPPVADAPRPNPLAPSGPHAAWAASQASRDVAPMLAKNPPAPPS